MSKFAFLPQDYQAPKGGSFYMKLQDGENKFRILSQPILGWEDWIEKKPVRWRFEDKPAKPHDAKKPVKHFWSMIVWNHAEEEIQILHLTQASIRSSIEALCNDSDWGAPYFYDLKIIRKGEGMETEYMVNPLPHKKLPAQVIDKFHERPINLDALFDNQDPFNKESHVFTAGIFPEADLPVAVSSTDSISEIEIADLMHILDECQIGYKEWVLNSVKKTHKANSVADLSAEVYQQIKVAALKNMEDTHAAQRNREQKAMKEKMQ